MNPSESRAKYQTSSKKKLQKIKSLVYAFVCVDVITFAMRCHAREPQPSKPSVNKKFSQLGRQNAKKNAKNGFHAS